MKLICLMLCTFATMFSSASEHKPRLELFYSPYCYYSHKVLNYLKEIHKTVPLRNVIEDEGAKEELKEKGGKMQVPCLMINDKPLYESDDIIVWLSKHKKCLETVHNLEI